MELSLDSLIASWQFVWQENNFLIANLNLKNESETNCENIQNKTENETEKFSKNNKGFEGFRESESQNVQFNIDGSNLSNRNVLEGTSGKSNDSSDFSEHFETTITTFSEETTLSDEISDLTRLSNNEWLENVCKKRQKKRYRSDICQFS